MSRLTQSALISEPSGKEDDNRSLSSIATSRFSSRCIREGNKDKVLPISLEKPNIFNEHISGGNSTKCSISSRPSAFHKQQINVTIPDN